MKNHKLKMFFTPYLYNGTLLDTLNVGFCKVPRVEVRLPFEKGTPVVSNVLNDGKLKQKNH